MVGERVKATRVYPAPADTIEYVMREFPEQESDWVVAGHTYGTILALSHWEDLGRLYLHLEGREMWRLEKAR